ncbi:mushroom body large-type Kenyon cell-specific protein 1-like protein [Leptotrombidium deliense]|uniref:Mushroom body large-type Kenyon cell-specific protein 1-like protein n=1 Tax=Leptotrombidium deliense TaxID=299467 RepID=A0A443SSK2_9ACAR|nr:mushroom body large-type Kenyon cell-specific protein 1-like protein [Leptotrombidium deliense]
MCFEDCVSCAKNAFFIVAENEFRCVNRRLERIAEELTGSRKWKSMYPFNNTPESEPKDWDPDEKCYICNKCHPSSHSMHSSHSESVCVNSCKAGCDCGSDDIETKHSSEQPLDLSVHSRDKQTDRYKDGSEMVTNSVLKVPQPSTAKSSKRRGEGAASKRSYTETELQAALADIQSGKLGTRRAAMIYGIPRSTLRNKVYKLSHEKAANNVKKKPVTATEPSTVNSTKPPVKNHREPSAAVANHSIDEVAQNSYNASESLKQILKQAITQRANNNYTVQDFNSCSSKSHPDTSNQMCNLFADPLAAFLDPGTSLSPLLSQFLLNVQHLALMRNDEEYNNYNVESLSSGNLAVLPDLVRKLTEERLEKERSKVKSEKEENDANSGGSVILKVPSYKPKRSVENTVKSKRESGDEKESSQCSGDAELVEKKDEEVKEKLNSNFYNNVDEYSDHESSSDALNSESKSILDSKSDKRTCSSLNTSDQSNPSTPDGKRNRPKRGRYRNYNRDDLAKAVRAVQKGEMSVHRAVKSNSSQSSGSPNSNSYAAVSFPLWQAALPLFSGDLGASQNSNFFASNMMRKLQENARLSEESHQQPNSNSNDFSLLENVIKSSLEKKSLNSKDKDSNNDQLSDKSKFNASLVALKEVSALDKKD